jgi:predicted  nucleic acid-binding Zn-ribbon protein
MDLVEKLDAFEIKIRRLILLNQQLREENEQLHGEVIRIQNQLNQHEMAMREMQERLAESENSTEGQLVGVQNSKGIKRQIDSYVRKIDKLIEVIENS